MADATYPKADTYKKHWSRVENRARLFTDAYESQGDPVVDPRGGAECVLNSSEEKCRYCGRERRDGEKWKRAHVVPEMLGNRSIVSNAECTECNERFSVYERHLKHFLGPSRALFGVRGKRRKGGRVRPYENPETGSAITFVEGEDHLVVDVDLDADSVEDDVEARSLSFDTETGPYVPLKVWKALVRIGIPLMSEEELAGFNWLRSVVATDEGDEEFRSAPQAMCRLYWQSLPGAGLLFDPVQAELYELKSETAEGSDGEIRRVPAKTLVLKWGRSIFQLFLFSDDDMREMAEGLTWSFLPYPAGLARHLFEGFGDVEFADYHLCSPNEVDSERRSVVQEWNGERRPLTLKEARSFGIDLDSPPLHSKDPGSNEAQRS